MEAPPEVTQEALEGEEVILDENKRRDEIGAKFFAVGGVAGWIAVWR
jgi:hypothetical protein